MSKVLVRYPSMSLSVTYSKTPNKKHLKGQAQPIKTLAPQPDDLNSISRIHALEGENSHKVKISSGVRFEGMQSMVAEKSQ